MVNFSCPFLIYQKHCIDFYLDFEASGEEDVVEILVGGFETGFDMRDFVEGSSGEDVTQTYINTGLVTKPTLSCFLSGFR